MPSCEKLAAAPSWGQAMFETCDNGGRKNSGHGRPLWQIGADREVYAFATLSQEACLWYSSFLLQHYTIVRGEQRGWRRAHRQPESAAARLIVQKS